MAWNQGGAQLLGDASFHDQGAGTHGIPGPEPRSRRARPQLPALPSAPGKERPVLGSYQGSGPVGAEARGPLPPGRAQAQRFVSAAVWLFDF